MFAERGVVGVRVQVLGPVRVRRGEVELVPRRAPRAVLGLLALASGQPVSRAEIVDMLWPDRPPASAVNVVQTYVKYLRQLLEPNRPRWASSVLLPGAGDGYALQVPPDEVDLGVFRLLVGEAEGAQRNGDPARAASLLASALSMWRSRPLADVPQLVDHPKLTSLLGERRLAAGRYGDAMIAGGTPTAAIPLLEEIAAEQPLDEAAHARLILAYTSAAQRDRASAAFHEIRRRLADELGADPGPELQAAHLAVISGNAGSTGNAGRQPVPPAPAQLPSDVFAFTGRTGELAELERMTSENPTAVLVSGTAGVGKTALAVRWASLVRDRFPDGQLYVNLRGYDHERPVPPTVALGRFAHALGASAQDIPADEDARAATYRSLLDGRRVLIVLDNALTEDQVRPLLPGPGGCLVLVTSRDTLPGLIARDGARRLDLDLLPPDDARDLLRRLVGARIDVEQAAATSLVRSCSGLPIALRVAAELAIARARTSLTDLAGELADHQQRLESLDAGGDTRAGVSAVFSWSLRHLPADVGHAFRLLGLHPGPDFDAYAVAALMDADILRARRTVDALTRVHLLHATTRRRYGMHDLLRAYAAHLSATMHTAPERRAALDRLFDYYLAACSSAMDILHPAETGRRPRPARPTTPVPVMADPDAARAWLDEERACIREVAAHAASHGWPAHATRLSAVLWRYLDGSDPADALAIHDRALAVVDGEDDPAIRAQVRFGVATTHTRLSRHDSAVDHLHAALALYRQAGDRAGEARTYGVLGVVDGRTGRLESAAEHLGHAIAAGRQTGDRTGEANALNNLGIVYGQLGRHEPSAANLRQAMALFRQIGDPTGEANALNNLGFVEHHLGRHTQAADHVRRSLALYRRTGNRRAEARALDSLGTIYIGLGRPDQAVECLEHALTLFEGVDDREGQAWALNGLAEAHYATGDAVSAISHHTRALAVAGAVGALDQQARAHKGLGRTHQTHADRLAACEHYEQAMAAFAAIDYPDADEIRAHLATCSLPDHDHAAVHGLT